MFEVANEKNFVNAPNANLLLPSRLARFMPKKEKASGRRQRKELKNRKKKVSGKEKTKLGSCKRNGK